MIDWDSLVIGPTAGIFGEPVIYTAAGYLPLTIQAVFFRASMQLLPMGGSGGQEPYLLGASGDLTTREPMLGVQLSQLFAAQPISPPVPLVQNVGLGQPTFGLYPTPPPATVVASPSQGDTAQILSLGLTYAVKEVLPDGVGHARLTLTLITGG